MKLLLIIIVGILIYILGAFATCVLILYIDRCEFGPQSVYSNIDAEYVGFCLFWPITIWPCLGYIIVYAIKKYAIAVVETIYQVTHDSEVTKDDNDNDD